MKSEINETRSKNEKEKQWFGRAALSEWRIGQQSKDKHARPDFFSGKETASEGYRKAWETRKERPKYMKPWDKLTDTSLSKGDYLAPEMADKCGQYYKELTAFAGNKENEQKRIDILNMSAGGFQSMLDRWKNTADRYSSIAQSAHKKVPDQSFTPEQRARAFNLLAVMVDRFQYMQWRVVNNADKDILDEKTLNKACEILENSQEATPEYYRALFTILDGVHAIQNSHSMVSDRPSREQPSSSALVIKESLGADVNATASDNLVISTQEIAELEEKGTIIEHLLHLEALKEKSKNIPEINCCDEEDIFKKIQAFRKKYRVEYDDKKDLIYQLERQIIECLTQSLKILKESQNNGSKTSIKAKEINDRKKSNIEKLKEYINQISMLKSIGDEKLDKAYTDNCNTEKELDKTLDEIRQFREKIEKEIESDAKQQPQEGNLLKDKLVEQARQLEESLRQTRESVRDILIDQAQLVGKFYLYALEHQRYPYDASASHSDLLIFYQGNKPVCSPTSVAMLVADQYRNYHKDKDLIKTAREAFPDISFEDNEDAKEIVIKAMDRVKFERGLMSLRGHDTGNELIALNKFLAPTGKKYVRLQKVNGDELQYFIQKSMDHKERGSILAGWSSLANGHSVVIDSRREERLNVRSPAIGPYGIREDLHPRYFNSMLLVPLETWKEFITECRKNNRQRKAIRVVTDPSGPGEAELIPPLSQWYDSLEENEIVERAILQKSSNTGVAN